MYLQSFTRILFFNFAHLFEVPHKNSAKIVQNVFFTSWRFCEDFFLFISHTIFRCQKERKNKSWKWTTLISIYICVKLSCIAVSWHMRNYIFKLKHVYKHGKFSASVELSQHLNHSLLRNALIIIKYFPFSHSFTDSQASCFEKL